MEQWGPALLDLFPQARLREPLSRHTTFHIGGPADAYLEIASPGQLPGIFTFARERGIPVLMVGCGSNLLCLDGGVRGIVIRLRGEFERLQFLEGGRVRAGAGARLPQLAVECAEHGLAGAETLVGVPGTVGGGVVMNAGTREGEIGSLVHRVLVFDPQGLQEAWVERPQLQFRYRGSNLENRVILLVELVLKTGSKVDILNRIQELQKRRQQTQPIHTYNVGSVFKNPPGHFVAKLIEGAGLKGERRGGARVSPLHANFIENDGRATASDVLELVGVLRDGVRERFGLELELEMKVIGEA